MVFSPRLWGNKHVRFRVPEVLEPRRGLGRLYGVSDLSFEVPGRRSVGLGGDVRGAPEKKTKGQPGSDATQVRFHDEPSILVMTPQVIR